MRYFVNFALFGLQVIAGCDQTGLLDRCPVATCDDNIQCTRDACDTATGACTFEADDGLCGADERCDLNLGCTPRAQCPAPLALPPTVGCDGLLLTAPGSVDTQSAGITNTTGPAGASAIRIDDGQSIDIKDEGCLQLGKNGADFSLSMWLKANPQSSQIIGTKSQYNGTQQGFILATKGRSDGDLELFVSSVSDSSLMASVTSIPFRPGEWVHVGLRYDNNGAESTFTIDVNLESRAGSAAPDVYNSKLRVGDEGFGTIAPFEISELYSYGRLLSDREVKALFLEKAAALGISSPSELSTALDRLAAHISGQTPLTPAELDAELNRFLNNADCLDTDAAIMQKVLDLVDGYETNVGPLFLTDATKKGIARNGAVGDALQLARAMVSIQQTVLEQVFSTTNVQHCYSLLAGRRFKTAEYFPGTADPPADPTKKYNVTISAEMPAVWGRPVAFATAPIRRPTGLYLSPGSISEVFVPQDMVGAGYSVLVGAHTADHSSKSTLRRLDRVTKTFPITQRVTWIANPLGGGVYIVVPYLANLGLRTVSISGVIEAPFFSLKSFDQTTNAQWQQRRTAPAPWADFESDKFMMQVPTSWIYAFDDPLTLMQNWDKAMDGVSELFGYPPEKRNMTVLYLQVDLQIRHGAYGIGYPQINNTHNPTSVENGNKDHWFIRDPTANEVDYHELGHAQLFTKFRGEAEAAVNLPHAYVRNAKFGADFDVAFQQSFGPHYGAVGFQPDDAAIHWMVTENFRNRREMDYTNSTKNEFRYQQRGYAKYADVYRIFGWKALTDFFHQEHLDYMNNSPSDGLDEVDSRILRMSVAAGGDLTPLIHFWGIHPVNPAALKQKMADQGIGPSAAVQAFIERYKTTAPKNNADFNAHYQRVYPKGCSAGADPDYGCGWYEVWKNVFGATEAAQIQTSIQNVLDLYYP